jgi:hypothetical protein
MNDNSPNMFLGQKYNIDLIMVLDTEKIDDFIHVRKFTVLMYDLLPN